MILTHVITLFTLLLASSLLTIAVTPALTAFLYRHRLGKQIRDAHETPIYSSLHASKAGTPTMGGILIWGSTLVVLVLAWLIHTVASGGFWSNLNFWSRSETYLPIGLMVLAALLGLLDDFFNVRQRGAHGGGLRVRYRLLAYSAIALVGALWFFFKLDWTTIHIPFAHNIDIGAWYIPIFIFVIVATSFSVNEADGLDGLAGGLLLAAFTAYGVITVVQGRIELASLVAVIVGSLTAFLWFNIPPARFFMGDTGVMSLGVTLGVLAMLTNTIWLLPIIGLPFVVESGSVILQLASKRWRKKKIFLSAPIHHHLEAKGWSEPKIVMRFWIIGALMSIVGLVLFFLDIR
ncbi:MAG: phospho-N-acetylmuramoyl-pentapeptide-transferase [Candidatus Kerfeldbacteria bacterium]|nr:phospho-N-acetylmuramoyl-pentapeptide-transferase [Candidatus Kerfeldbacteria bacterium]